MRKTVLLLAKSAIPIRVLFDAFIAAETAAEMQVVIDAYHVAVVTCDEDARLRSARLQSKMPNGWKWGDDPLARWHSVGIEVIEFKSDG